MLSEATDKLENAMRRIQAGPQPAWVCDCPYDKEFKARPDEQLTHLLIDRQVHAERREHFLHVSFRLGTMDAVQQHSQWKLQFEPRTHSVTLHFLKLRRGELQVDHLDLRKSHLLQREQGLDGFVIDGWFTLLMVLEDVRPGDIIEWAYTVVTTPNLLPGHCVTFFNLPEWASIGRYHFSVRFLAARPMKWRSSLAELKPTETMAGELTLWTWTAEKHTGLRPEANTPSWYVSSPWMQASDCPDWQTVAAAIAESWAQQVSHTGLDGLIQGIEQQCPDLSSRIDKAIQLIQDDYRYLSVNLEFGGQIPAPTETVIRRRYGDCKDLSFLLTNVLNRLGVSARPVLVHTGLRKSIGHVLPGPSVFNHVIVELEAEGKKRWIDTTLKHQGGGAYNRVVPNYGLGLPVSRESTGLVEPPAVPGQSNLYEAHETLLLDTTGKPSLLAVVVRAEGSQADILRAQLKRSSLDDVAKERLQSAASRFAFATRVGSLQHRDDRASNQFVLAEKFEINGFLLAHNNPGMCRFRIPCTWINSLLLMPEQTERRTPFSLPYPMRVVHVVDVEFSTLPPMTTPRSSLQSQYVQFTHTKKNSYGYWMITFSLNTLADSVPSEQTAKHRELVEEIWKQSSWELYLPVGYSRPRQKHGFGELPLPRPRADGPPPSKAVTNVEKSKDPVPVAAGVPALPQSSPPELVTGDKGLGPCPQLELESGSGSKPHPSRHHRHEVKSKGWRRFFGF